MFGAFAEFERELIRARQREGIAIAKAKGVYKGRKKALGAEEAHELVEQARAGIPKADLARVHIRPLPNRLCTPPAREPKRIEEAVRLATRTPRDRSKA